LEGLMIRIWRLSLLAAAAALLWACVPTAQQTQLEGQLLEQPRSQARIEERLQAETVRRRQAEQELAALQAAAGEHRSRITTLAARSTAAEERADQLAEQVTALQLEIQKRDTAIGLQNRVIRLLDDPKETIETSLKEQLSAQNITLEEIDGRLKMIFVDRILFDSGSAEIQEEGKQLLLSIAETLRRQQEALIVIEGHTDNLPIAPAARKRFSSNWELSAARASAVARFLAETAGLDPHRLVASGFSRYRPLTSNDTAEGRQQNRRIEIFFDVLR
jgi:chemotaxis protein MotB